LSGAARGENGRHDFQEKMCQHAPRAAGLERLMRPRNSTGDSFFAWEGEVLVVNILGKPSAARDAIGKPKGTQLKVSVTASPQAGKATDHMLRFLAPLFGVAVADIELVFGRENVNKQLRIRAPKKLPSVFTQQPVLPAED
jgi:uncharacterized protein